MHLVGIAIDCLTALHLVAYFVGDPLVSTTLLLCFHSLVFLIILCYHILDFLEFMIIPYYVFYLSRQNFSGRQANFSSPNKNSSLTPHEKFFPIKVKVSLVEVQVNLKG